MSIFERLGRRFKRGTSQGGVFGTMGVRITARYAAGLIAAVVLLSACGVGPSQQEPAKPPRYTYQQAKQIANQSLNGVAESLHPPAKLEKIGAGQGLHPPCAGPNDDRDTGMVMYELGYHLGELRPGQQADVYEQVKEYWRANGYVLVQDEPFGAPPSGWQLIATQRNTEFAMRLQQTIGPGGILTLTAQSPCVQDGRITESLGSS